MKNLIEQLLRVRNAPLSLEEIAAAIKEAEELTEGMTQLITWRDLLNALNTLTNEQLDCGIAINLSSYGNEGEFFGTCHDDSWPKIYFAPEADFSPLDENEPFLRLES